MRRIAHGFAAVTALGIAAMAFSALGLATGAKTGGTLRVNISNSDVTSLDPAIDYEFYGWTVLSLTCAKLVNYPDRPAPAGSQLVPEVAAGFPRVSRDGRTYMFTIRSDYRFNTGERVSAASFARAFARDLDPKMSSPAVSFMGDIVGAAAVVSKKAKHASGIRVNGDKLTITLTRPAPDLLARLAMNFFCAVPTDLPIDARGVTSPGAGPYYVAKRIPGRSIEIKRNPFYRGPRPHNADRIDITVNTNLQQSLLQVEAGQADYDLAGVPPTQPALLAQKYGINKERFFVHPALAVAYLALNTSRPPFDDVKVRHAVNFAISRMQIMNQSGYKAGTPTDQFLPPTMRGFHDAKIYPLETPDVDRAKRLLNGRTFDVTLYTTTDQTASQQAQVVQTQLERIGIHVSVKQYSFGVLVSKTGVVSEPYNIVALGWFADYADPYDFINVLLEGNKITKTNNVNLAQFNDPLFNRQIKQASLLSGPRRYAAYGKLDVDISRVAAPWASLYNNNFRELVSKRVGCYIYQPSLAEIDLAAACIK
jgi:ABC-type transport system substrate-binding protein